MKSSSKYSLSSVSAAVAAALNPAIGVAQDSDDNALDEVIVTATKRAVSVQDIPASVQAITQESLDAMGARTMEDYARFVPSVNVVTYGSGSSSVVFRGATTLGGAQATASVYLDEISVTQTGSQPTLRAVDIERVEALSGPQGTLYGSDAQAGTMRIITNKPVMNEFEAVFDGELRGGSGSDPSYRGSLVFNVPLVEDKLALRVVGFSDSDGGFIDNVLGRTADWHGIDRSDPANNKNPGQFGTLDNAASVEENWNEEDVTGGRLHLLWQMNDRWSAMSSYHYQKSDSGAGNEYDPFVGDLQTVRFHNDWREEEFNMASLQIEGDMEFAQLVAAVSYWERDVVEVYDVTTYVHYWAANYCHDTAYDQSWAYASYYWANPDTGNVVWWPVYCVGPSVDADFFAAYGIDTPDDKLTAEIRLQGSGDTLEWLIGGFYEESSDAWNEQFAMVTNGGHVRGVEDGIFAGSVARDYYEWSSGEDLSNTTQPWTSGQIRDWNQKAIFGEATWHINDSWDLTLGGRYFERETDRAYWLNRPGRYYPDEGLYGNEPVYRAANNSLPPVLTSEESQFVPKLSLTYQLTDDRMVYALYTQGVRQGGVNQTRGEPLFADGYDSDTMTNYEMGYKSNFANGRGRLNITAYHMAWEEYQLSTLDPSFVPCPDPTESIPQVCGQPWQTVVGNLGDAHITGVNVMVDYAPNENWVLGFNYEKMESETDTNHDLNGNGEFEITKGLRLPITPAYKAATWAEYRRPTSLLGADDFFIRGQWSFTGDSLNSLQHDDPATSPNPQLKNPAYNIGDIRVGLVGEDWQVDLFVRNVSDERAQYTGGATGQYIWGAAQTVEGREHHMNVYTNRPREYGVRYMKRWGD